MAKKLDLLMKEDKKYKNKPTIKEPTVEEQLAAYTGKAPLPTVSSQYNTQNVANMKNYIGEQNIPQTPLNPQTSLNPQAELDKIMNYYGVGKTPGATPLSAYTPAPSAPTPVTTPSTKTDIKEPTVEEQLAAYTGKTPLPTVSSQYKTLNIANMEAGVPSESERAYDAAIKELQATVAKRTANPLQTTPATYTDAEITAAIKAIPNNPVQSTQQKDEQYYIDQINANNDLNSYVAPKSELDAYVTQPTTNSSTQPSTNSLDEYVTPYNPEADKKDEEVELLSGAPVSEIPQTTPTQTTSAPTTPTSDSRFKNDRNGVGTTDRTPYPVTPTTTPTTTTSTEDEFRKWYADAQAKQDAINDEVTDTIKKWYSSKTEQEKSFYEQQLAMMQSQYEQNQQMLDQAKSQERREADILHSRMMKYLPEQMKAQGLSGLGISQSLLANAQNSLSSQLGDINQYYNQQAQMGNSEHQQNQMNLMQNYLSNQMNTDQSYEQALLSQYGNYADRTSALGSQQREERIMQEQYARQEAQNTRDTLIQPNLQSMYQFNADGTITNDSYNNAKAYIDSLDIPNILKNSLYTEIDLYKNGPPKNIGKKTELTFVKNDAGKFKPKDTFFIKGPNGTEYKVNSAGIVEDADIIEIGSAYDPGDIFIYGDTLYYKDPTGIVQIDKSRDYSKLVQYLK